jgi:hypothetical protein
MAGDGLALLGAQKCGTQLAKRCGSAGGFEAQASA